MHSATRAWFESALGAPSAPQAQGWPTIRSGAHTLIAAPTGSGKTLAAFLWAIDGLVRDGLAGNLQDETRVLYISPLKALGNDVEQNLQRPIEGIASELRARSLPEVKLRTAVRSGDTPASRRTALARKPPHVLVTTPESLYIMLTSESGRRVLRTVRTVIVDEIHALVTDRRGAHLALSLERLQALVDGPLTRIGLSATQTPIEEVLRFLVGAAPERLERARIVDCGHRRDVELAIELPRSPLEPVMATEVWTEVYDRLAELAAAHRTTLVFTNTRRLCERVARHLAERMGEAQVAAHHGSLAREQRLQAEQRLKAGELRVLVATASLELGIDIGSVDLVCQLGTTRSISALWQRVGRSGHSHGALARGRILPLSQGELIEAVALLNAVRAGKLDRIAVPLAPRDVLAQQIVAALACEDWTADALYAQLCRAYPYRALSREDFDAVVRMLADGFRTGRGRRAALIHHDRVNGQLRARRAWPRSRVAGRSPISRTTACCSSPRG
jgi:ATP-dependent Lhr-like helicase